MTETPNVDPGQTTPPDPPEPPAPKYTDQDLDKYKGSARKEGRQAAVNELLTQAGAESVNDLVAAWQEKQQLEQAAQTEAERLQQQINAITQERDQANQLAQQRLVEAELRNQLIAAGVPAGSVQLQDAMRVVDTASLEVGDDGAVQGAQEAVQGALEARPWLTGAQQQQVHAAVDTTQTARGASDSPEGAMASFLGSMIQRQ